MTERDLNRGSGFTPGSSTPPGGSQPAQSPSSDMKSAASDFGNAASSAARQTGGSLKEKVNEDWQNAKSAAQGQISNATDRVRDAADDQKNFAAERVSGFASAIEKVGDELEQGDQRDQREVGRYAKQIGASIHRFADDMKGKDMGEIAGMAEDFGRRQPAAFIGLAALAGFAASRFLTASAERRASTDTSSTAGRPSTVTGSTTSTTPSMTSTTPASTATTTPVRPATGSGYATGYSPEGNRNG